LPLHVPQVPGLTHAPSWQVKPCAHVALELHEVAHMLERQR
jgi:hypothetical protein